MGKIYKGSFMKDYLWMTLIIGGLGALLVLMPLVVLYLWITDVTGAGTKLSDIFLNVAFFFLMFIFSSGICFYLLWRGTQERLVVDDGALTYATTFFTRKVPVISIDKIMIFDKARPIVIYDQSGTLKRMKLPVWKSNDYVGSLLADLKPMNPNIDVVDLRKGAAVEATSEVPAQ